MDLNIILLNNLNNNNISLELTIFEIDFLKNILLTKPEIFIVIKEQINDIIIDEMINYYDFPEIILIISDIYSCYLIENIIEDIGIINIVKFTIDSIINSNLFQIHEIKKEYINKIVESSISLLKFNTNFIKDEKETCFDFIFRR
jgi:hypothetical protein